MKKLNKVLLIDDDPATNFIHRRVIDKYGFAEMIVEKLNGKEAIDYLTTEENSCYPQPELIFLDVNMPLMDGWEFIDAYENLPETQQAGPVIVMLTTSLNPADKERAESSQIIRGFQNKLLTVDALDSILAEHYPECVREK
jgi:CheY-like chemotaxis protein